MSLHVYELRMQEKKKSRNTDTHNFCILLIFSIKFDSFDRILGQLFFNV